MKLVEKRKHDGLDEEWIELMREARKIGRTPAEIRDFLFNFNVVR